VIYEIWACKRVEGSDRGLLRRTILVGPKENHEKCKDTRLNIVRTVHHVLHYPSTYQLSSTTLCFFTQISVPAPTRFAIVGLKLPEDGVNSWIKAP
jgi:hypothetical protein